MPKENKDFISYSPILQTNELGRKLATSVFRSDDGKIGYQKVIDNPSPTPTFLLDLLNKKS